MRKSGENLTIRDLFKKTNVSNVKYSPLRKYYDKPCVVGYSYSPWVLFFIIKTKTKYMAFYSIFGKLHKYTLKDCMEGIMESDGEVPSKEHYDNIIANLI